MESLKRVQRIAKIFEIIARIIFVFCVIGLVSCILGTFGIILAGRDAGNWAEISKIAETKIVFEECLCVCLVGTILCAGETALYYYVKKFYKKELEIGTPFDKTVVKGMRNIALLHITIPLGTSIVCMIVMALCGVNLNFLGTVDLSVGLVYLALSLVFDYGADLRQIEVETVKIKEEILKESTLTEDVPVVVEPQEEEQRVVKKIEVVDKRPTRTRKTLKVDDKESSTKKETTKTRKSATKKEALDDTQKSTKKTIRKKDTDTPKE